jgi:squalene-hopene/tetraprenyl-beta-curcumene cyclase
MRTSFVPILALAMMSLSSVRLSAADASVTTTDKPVTETVHVSDNVRGGLAWLASKQKENGSWSNENFPALTALPLRVFLAVRLPEHESVIQKAVKFISAHIQEDGGIYKKSFIPGRGGLSTYNTAMCMTALHETGDASMMKTVLAARKFVSSSQRPGEGDHAGGFGYSRGGLFKSTDLINTSQAFEAMRITQSVEDLRPAKEGRVDIDWKAAQAYLKRVQNAADAGSDQAGGFYYKPGRSAAGTTTNVAGEVIFRSYGSMTYLGLLSLMYADVSREDPRVRSAFDWATKHWSLDENPGLGGQGMYFFYHVLAKSLSAYGADEFSSKGDRNIRWKAEIVARLDKLKHEDGETVYWINENGRYWESDPVLVTSYCILALQLATAE